MKLFKSFIFGVLVLGLFVGCSSKSTSPASIDVKSGKGAIVIYRPHNSIWRHKRFNIYINGNYEDILMNRSHHVFDKAPGEYVVELREDVEINPEVLSVKIQLNEGKTKYIKLGTQGIEGHLKLKSVMKASAIADEWYKKRY